MLESIIKPIKSPTIKSFITVIGSTYWHS